MQLLPNELLPPRLTDKFTFVPCPADGRCFWTAVYLGAIAAKSELLGWYKRPRNSSGYTSGADAVMERDKVLQWALSLEGLPQEMEQRIRSGISADADEIES